MKVILYMALSANGMLAKTDDSTPWSDEEWQSFNGKVKEIGNILIGRRTYELMREDGSLNELPCSLIMVLTSNKRKTKSKRVVFCRLFFEAIKAAQDRGFKQVLVGGGSKTNATALGLGKVNEVYLDIEPWLFGKGLPLFTELSRNYKLKLLGTRKIGKDGIQLHYRISKKA